METQVLEPYFTTVMAWITVALEAMGVGAIFFGIIAATVGFLRKKTSDEATRFEYYRRKMGRSILLGLEFLVAADIVNTVTAHLTYKNLGLLAILILIRTFLSFTIELEVDGLWPWHKDKEAA
jgi:uncharacterized membrane protein